MSDSLVKKSHEVRDQLLRESGGLDGLCQNLGEMDREREQAAHKWPQVSSGRKSSRPRSAKGPNLQTHRRVPKAS